MHQSPGLPASRARKLPAQLITAQPRAHVVLEMVVMVKHPDAEPSGKDELPGS